jgi:transglutaminase-like putative cysteine protease
VSRLGRLIRGLRHPLRALALALATFAITAGVAMTEGVFAAVVGTLVGLVAGERLAASKWRTEVAAGGAAGASLLVWLGAWLLVATEAFPEVLGPGTTLRLVGVVRYAATAMGVTAALRVVAKRHRPAMALELALVVAAISVSLAAHRDGVVARPLWLSDWAWQLGIDPVHVLLTIGGAAVVLLFALLLAESEGEPSLASLVALPLLALLAVSTLDVTGLPTPPSDAGDLGLLGQPGEEPRTPPPLDGGRGGRGGREDDGGGSGQGRDDGGRGGGGPETGDAGTVGGGDGGMDAGAGGADGARDGGGGSGRGDGSVDGAAAGSGDGSVDGGVGVDGDGSAPQQPPLQFTDAGVTVPPVILDGGSGASQPPDGGGQWERPRRQRRSDEPGDPTRGGSPTPMAIVILEDDYSPPTGAYYFRQGAWSEYSGSRLVASSRDDVDLDILRDFPTAPVRVRDPAPSNGRIKVSGRVALLVEHDGPFALETALSLRPSPNPNPSRFVRAFRFTSLAQTAPFREFVGKKVGDPRWSDEVRAHYLRGPEDPRYAQLAREIVVKLPPERREDAFAQAVAVKLWLDEHTTYSTRERHAGVEDSTASFLFGNRTGYCVHFAHAAVYLWRSLGIPARVGVGYHFDEQNRRGGSAILLRGNDGHAWPELYVEGHGWIVLDVAPRRNLDPPGDAPDDDLQRMLGEMAREEPPDPMQEAPKRHQPPPPWRRIFGTALLLAVALALAVLFGAKMWRRACPLWAARGSVARVSYRAALDALAELGLHRETGESREAFADRVAGVAPSFRRLTDLLVAHGLREPHTPDDARPERDRTVVLGALRATRRELRTHTRFRRRVLGLLDPTSFLRSR